MPAKAEVPEEAVAAALKDAVRRKKVSLSEAEEGRWRREIRLDLQAAAPAIRNEERQRIREALKEQAAECRREATGSGRESMLAAASVVDCVTEIISSPGAPSTPWRTPRRWRAVSSQFVLGMAMAVSLIFGWRWVLRWVLRFTRSRRRIAVGHLLGTLEYSLSQGAQISYRKIAASPRLFGRSYGLILLKQGPDEPTAERTVTEPLDDDSNPSEQPAKGKGGGKR